MPEICRSLERLREEDRKGGRDLHESTPLIGRAVNLTNKAASQVDTKYS
jgi:hypothetical protein